MHRGAVSCVNRNSKTSLHRLSIYLSIKRTGPDPSTSVSSMFLCSSERAKPFCPNQLSNPWLTRPCDVPSIHLHTPDSYQWHVLCAFHLILICHRGLALFTAGQCSAHAWRWYDPVGKHKDTDTTHGHLRSAAGYFLVFCPSVHPDLVCSLRSLP